MAKELKFPKKFRDQIGKHVEYTCGEKKEKGIINAMRWSTSFIINMEKMSQRWYGIQFRIKPDSGKRAFWTEPFNSGVKRPASV